jgi:N-acetylglucosaminyltransferase II (MGAT2)/Glycosyl hydrolases family 38 N-terminal domain/Alpha mannosidase middle domain/Glycosyl hydrolases family 38 C-terminal domain
VNSTSPIVDPWNGQLLQPHDIFTHVMPFYSYDIPHTCGPNPAVCCQFDFGLLAKKEECPWDSQPEVVTAANVKEKALLLLDQYRRKAALYRSNAVLIPLGADFRYVQRKEAEAQFTNYQAIFDYINDNVPGVTIQFGTLSDYFTAARQSFEGPVPILKGSFLSYSDLDNDYWSGYYTNEPTEKLLSRQLESVLYAAEKLGVRKTDLQGPRRALAWFQNHNGVTGTSSEEIKEEYAKRMFDAFPVVHTLILTKPSVHHKLSELITLDEGGTIRSCLGTPGPRVLQRNICSGTNVTAYNPIETDQRCGNIVVKGGGFANVQLPCETPGPAKATKTRFVFDLRTGLMIKPIKEEWKVWNVEKGGACLFTPGTLADYDMQKNNLEISDGGFIVSTDVWKRTVIEKDVATSNGAFATAIDFIYDTMVNPTNQELVVRFASNITNGGYFHTDINGFEFETHRFRPDRPIQSHVHPMPTFASIQDEHLRMTVLSEYTHGAASLQNGSIDVWLDRALNSVDNRGSKYVPGMRRSISRFRVVLEHEGYDARGEFAATQLSRQLSNELLHPLMTYGHIITFMTPYLLKAKSAFESGSAAVEEREKIAKSTTPTKQGGGGASRNITISYYSVNNTDVPFVFMVFKRVDYLKEAMESLRKSDFPRHRVPIIISHDGNVSDVVEYVESIKSEFQIVQLFHPHSCYDHPHVFPGDNASLNEGYLGDAYNNPRSGSITCCKHHFTWILRTVFSNKKFKDRSIDTFLFLEEDYVVAPTIYQAMINGLNGMLQFNNETKGAFLGLNLDPSAGGIREILKEIDGSSEEWFAEPFMTGPMTLHRSTFERLQQGAAYYCGLDGFDEYNWDWSFVHIQNKYIIPHTMLSPAKLLARHIGATGGMHDHRNVVPPPLAENFVGTKVHGSVWVESRPRSLPRGNGGWKHPADHEHCLRLLSKE